MEKVTTKNRAQYGVPDQHRFVAQVGLILLAITSFVFLFGMGIGLFFPSGRFSLIDSTSKMFETVYLIFGGSSSSSISSGTIGILLSSITLLLLLIYEISSNAKSFNDTVALAWVPIRAAKSIASKFFIVMLLFNMLWIVINFSRIVTSMDVIFLTIITIMVYGAFFLVVDFLGRSYLGQAIPKVIVEVSKVLPDSRTQRIPDSIGGTIELGVDQSILMRLKGSESELVTIDREPQQRWRISSKSEGNQHLIVLDPKNSMRNASVNVKYTKGKTELLLRSYHVVAEGPQKIQLSLLLKYGDKQTKTEAVAAPMYMNFGDIYSELLKGVDLNGEGTEAYSISYIQVAGTGEVLEKTISLRYLDISDGEMIEMGLTKISEAPMIAEPRESKTSKVKNLDSTTEISEPKNKKEEDLDSRGTDNKVEPWVKRAKL
jgi:hypothetical protein